jgi:hypothetical protein
MGGIAAARLRTRRDQSPRAADFGLLSYRVEINFKLMNALRASFDLCQ